MAPGRRGRGAAKGSAAGLTPSTALVPQTKGKLSKPLRRLVAVRKVLADPIRNVLIRIPGGSSRVLETLAASTEDDEAQTVARIWRTMMRAHDFKQARHVDFYALCERAAISPRELIGIVCRCLFDFGEITERVLKAAILPQTMEASLLRSLEPDATAEREMHFKASGYLPTSKGIQIGINNVNRERDAEPGEAPAVSRTARRIIRDLPPVA